MIGKGYSFRGNRISPSQFIMLVILRKGPMYGYEVLKKMREEFEDLWEPQTGAVYPALKRMEEHGLLALEVIDGKDHYRLTDEGRDWLLERLESISSEVLFMARYLQFISEAVKEEDLRGRNGDGTINLPFHMAHLFFEDLSPKDRLMHMRKARDMLLDGAENLDVAIRRLEDSGKEE
jgi:DNA-binding PadR family transcriptional regulator